MYINLLRGAFLLSSNTLFLLKYWLSKFYTLSYFELLKTGKSGTNAAIYAICPLYMCKN